jgi:glycine/D-amino acid oxidase-like deaminating enzyme/nitrite reductase/ring-hydroxylating ferredoxin subunit
MTPRPASLWRATHELRRFSPLTTPATADVVLVGGGISGLPAAVILGRRGRRVMLLEADRLAAGETGNTTSHLTEAVDGRYHTLRRAFGEESTQLIARSSRAAIDWIDALASTVGADVGFSRVPGYLYTERGADLEMLANELDAATRAGCTVSWIDDAPVPFKTFGAIRWEGQAQVHATKYLDALVREALAHGVRIHEETRVIGVHDGEPCRVETERGEIHANDVFVAANVPVNNRVLLHTKITAYRSYAIACAIASPSAAGLYWDTDEPYHYTRLHPADGRHYLIVGGEDHRTGTDSEEKGTEEHYRRLTAYARERFGITDVAFRWSGQIIEPVDGLPYIGLNAASAHVYVATGYSGNGITFGTLAGTIVADLILGHENPYAALYSATRVTPVASATKYVTENALFPAHLVRDRLTNADAEERPIEALAPGDGAVFAGDKGKVAVCRDRSGALHCVSAVCTHLACDVAWNSAEQTWDCPCHGSRFSPEGTVINGPAVTALAAKPLPQLTK